jgi:hypothetical protein
VSKKTQKDLWFGVYGREYDVDEPAFFDDSVLPFADMLKAAYPVIRQELEPLMQDSNTDLVPYFDNTLQYPPKNWKTIGFYSWSRRQDNLDNHPELSRMLKKIPGLLTASFNLLEPQSRIMPHFGESNATYRIHLGIKVPAGLPECGFKVKEEVRPWQEGEMLVFLDANKHEAFNNTNKRRYILLLEVIRPEFGHLWREVCIRSLAVLTLYYVLSKIPFLPLKGIASISNRVPRFIQNLACYPLKVLWSFIFFFRRYQIQTGND